MASSLSRITFSRGTNSRTADAPAERRWVAPSTGEAGEATIRLPRNSTAGSSLYVARGSIARIHSEGDCGEWFGIVVDIDESDPHLLLLTAYQPVKVLGSRVVERLAALINVSAGMGATAILEDALTGVRGLGMPNAPFEGGVLGARVFEVAGGAWSGLTALMDATDGELHVTAGGDVNWCGPLAYASRYDTLLVDGGNFQDVSYQTTIQNRASEVSVGGGATAYTARSGNAARDGWPAQISMDGTPGEAQRELESRSLAAVTISGGVTSEHWGIRERDFPQVLATRAEFGGRLHRCRVLARSLADGDHLMRLELQVVQPVPATAITGGAGARQRPPQRPGADGSGGSFAQAFAGLRQLAFEINFARRYGISYDDFRRLHNGSTGRFA